MSLKNKRPKFQLPAVKRSKTPDLRRTTPGSPIDRTKQALIWEQRPDGYDFDVIQKVVEGDKVVKNKEK